MDWRPNVASSSSVIVKQDPLFLLGILMMSSKEESGIAKREPRISPAFIVSKDQLTIKPFQNVL
jgi:hypothetical protein